MAEDAQHHILGENDDWFDSVSIKRNMKELKGLTGQFKKTVAVEANLPTKDYLVCMRTWVIY